MPTIEKQEYQKQWFNRNREKARAWAREQYVKRKEYINKLKDKPCADCGQRFPLCCMDFDHVRGTKKFTFGGGKCGNPSFVDIDEEAEKCDVVCSNCHRIRTESRGYFKRRPLEE